MKNLLNKIKVVCITMCYFAITLFFDSCNNDNNETTDCGCDSKTIAFVPRDETMFYPDRVPLEVPIEEQKKGLLFFKHPENEAQPYNQYNNRFWILQKYKYWVVYRGNLVVCNENLLDSKYDYLKQKNVNDSIEVKFTGKLKHLCFPRFASPVCYTEIVLTSIEQR